MTSWRKKLSESPGLVRVAPFFLFAFLTFFQGKFGEESRYWFYFAKTILGAVMICVVWPFIPEMRWKFSLDAVLVGILVLIMWIGIDGFYPHLGQPTKGWNPHDQFGANKPLAWMFIIARLMGSTLVVPFVEEVFYRSFVYRYIINPKFETVPIGEFRWNAFLFTSVLFGFSHFEWLAGILCGFAYQGLVCRKKRLGDAITAHAITNFLLGLWIIWKNDWKFW